MSTETTTAAAAAETYTFDFYDDHCFYDVDDLRARLEPHQEALLVSLHPNAFTEWQNSDPVRAAVAELTRAGHDDLVDVLTDGLHTYEYCDCGSFAYESFSSWVDEALEEISKSNPDAVWVLTRHEKLDSVVDELDLGSLSERCLDGHRGGWHRMTLTLDHRGTGTLNLDGSVLSVAAIPSREHAILVERCYRGEWSDPENADAIDEVVRMQPEDATLLAALLAGDVIVRTAEQADANWDELFTDLTFAQAKEAIVPFATMSTDQKRVSAALARDWPGTVPELAEIVAVAHDAAAA